MINKFLINFILKLIDKLSVRIIQKKIKIKKSKNLFYKMN